MKLVVGGAYQGKVQFVCDTFGLTKEEMIDGATCEYEAIKEAKAIYNLQLYIKRLLMDGKEDKEFLISQIKKNPNIIVICNEMGSGLVPVEAFDRKYREMVGRVQCELAKNSKEVYRVYCGIGVKIK